MVSAWLLNVVVEWFGVLPVDGIDSGINSWTVGAFAQVMWARLRFISCLFDLPNNLPKCPFISLSTSSGEGLVLDVAVCWHESDDLGISSLLVGSECLMFGVSMTTVLNAVVVLGRLVLLVRDVTGCRCASVVMLVCLRVVDVEVLVPRSLLEGWRGLDVEF
jgi:hypothetical protein